MNPEISEFFASCPKGLESLLFKEIKSREPDSIKEIPGGIFFTGIPELGYRICLHSRIASRVFYKLSDFPAESPEELYARSREIDWSVHMDAEQTFAVSGNAVSSNINHSQFAALTVKDAIVDYFRDTAGKRPSVKQDRPDLQFNIFINKNHASLYLDFSGESLHRRGYRSGAGYAPLKENLAAGILLFSRWQMISERGRPLVDLMCGSGTFPIEAALISGNIAPGIFRDYFGFFAWKKFNSGAWEAMLKDAHLLAEEGKRHIPLMVGCDSDPEAVFTATENAKNAGLEDKIIFMRHKIEDPFSECEEEISKKENFTGSGLVIMNPPYGERMGAGKKKKPENLKLLYEKIGIMLRSDFTGWEAAVFTGNPDASREIRLRPRKVRDLLNGSIECRLLHYDIKTEIFYREDKNLPPEPLSEGAVMFQNRLQKNIKSIGKWARKNNIDCYRLYDADIPQYAVAVDVYEKFIHVQEYEAPSSIEEKIAKRRLREAMRVIHETLDVPEERIFLKVRRKQRGTSQYNRSEKIGEFHVIHEGGLKFLVNFEEYLDTGLFLDHRKTRFMIRDMAKDKDFLNLFAYTGSASVYAASGGAKSTVTVDMSNTYLEWAEKNMKLNGFSGRNHHFYRDDCVEWIRDCREAYDLIFLDPPTFSNSARMEGTFEVGRDHSELIRNTAELLRDGGMILFSNNYRNFKMDEDLLLDFQIKNITRETIQKDFEGNPRIHNCWTIQKK